MYKFVSSYKHMFCYEKDGVFFTIAGDTYRDSFYPTMTEEDMFYYIYQEGVEVYEKEL